MSNKGFTLMEAIITVSIMGILAAVVTPTYLETQTEAKLVMSQTNTSQLKQGIINLYLGAFMDGEYDVWPDEPTDHKMTHQWAESTTLYDGRTVAQLFSGSKIIYNPYDHPFLYYLLPEMTSKSGSSLIELALVISIIGVISVIALPKIGDIIEDIREKAVSERQSTPSEFLLALPILFLGEFCYISCGKQGSSTRN